MALQSYTNFLNLVVQPLSHVRLFVTRGLQASLSFTISWSLLKLTSIESVMSSNHLILHCPLLLLPSIFPSLSLVELQFPNLSSTGIICSTYLTRLYELGEIMCWRTLYTMYPHVQWRLHYPHISDPADLEVCPWGYHLLALTVSPPDSTRSSQLAWAQWVTLPGCKNLSAS